MVYRFFVAVSQFLNKISFFSFREETDAFSTEFVNNFEKIATNF